MSKDSQSQKFLSAEEIEAAFAKYEIEVFLAGMTEIYGERAMAKAQKACKDGANAAEVDRILRTGLH